MASGAPSIVTDAGGPKFIVRDGITGYVTHSDEQFVARTIELMQDRDLVLRMRDAGLQQAAHASWDRVFEDVYVGYREASGCASSMGRALEVSPHRRTGVSGSPDA
jgi:glycosyltransferase involved in cell wall biosynthesis